MPNFQAVVFDMDGTIIESLLDFKAIRAELGIAPSDGIIEAIAAMPSQQRDRCDKLLLDREITAARNAKAQPHAIRVVKQVKQAGLKTALLTRNAKQAMDMVLEQLDFSFDLTWSRHDGVIKPEPDGVLAACEILGVTPEHTLCVGDFRYDIEAANAAGAVSVLLDPKGSLSFSHLADHVISSLDELPGLLGIS